MRNKKITPKQEVPKNIRLQVYKESLAFIKANHSEDQKPYDLMSKNGLCLLLNCVLWDISYMDLAPNGEQWSCSETTLRFPEFTKYHLAKLAQLDFGTERVPYRIKLLESWIKKLEKDLEVSK